MFGAFGGPRHRRQPTAADIAEWVEAHYTPLTVDGTVVYDLTAPPKNS